MGSRTIAHLMSISSDFLYSAFAKPNILGENEGNCPTSGTMPLEHVTSIRDLRTTVQLYLANIRHKTLKHFNLQQF